MNTSSFFKKSIHFLFTAFIKPHSFSEDERRKEFIINIILSVSIIFLLFFDFLVLYNTLVTGALYHGESFVFFSLIVLFFILLLIASRKGYTSFSSYSLLTFCFIFSAVGIYRWGPDIPSCLLVYCLLIIISSILIGTRFSFIFFALIICTMILIYSLGTQGLISDTEWIFKQSKTIEVIKYGLLFALIAIISWLSNIETNKSLDRARKSEKELYEKTEKVYHLYRFAEFGRLSSGIFHDLMNPLTVVVSNIMFLKNTPTSSYQNVQKHIRDAVIASKRMEKFMLSIKKQMSVEGQECNFSLNEEIEGSLSILSHKALCESITLDFQANEEFCIYGSSIKLSQVITNLVGNAIDAYEGSNKSMQEKMINISLFKEPGYVVINVTDRASGIKPELVSKIFDPFFTTKTEYKGMGLGLSSTKNIIEDYFKGSISFTSTPGVGTQFTLKLPYKNEHRSIQ